MRMVWPGATVKPASSMATGLSLTGAILTLTSFSTGALRPSVTVRVKWSAPLASAKGV
jgi:hypothetical protein